MIAPDIANALVASGGGRVDPLDGNLVFNVATYEGGTAVGARQSDTAAALRSSTSTDDPGTVVVPFRKAQKAHHAADSERWEPAEVAGTLAAGGGDANGTIVVAADAVAYQLNSNGSNSCVGARATDTAGTLLAAAARAGAGTTEETVVLLIDGVRRLTPTECERLQGLPDGWTIPWGPSLLVEPAWHQLRDREPSVAFTGGHTQAPPDPLGDGSVHRVAAARSARRVEPVRRVPGDRKGAAAS